MNTYVTLDSKKYRFRWGSYHHVRDPYVAATEGLTGLTIVDVFSFTEYVWSMTLMVRRTEAESGYGDFSNFLTALGKDTVAFIDAAGDSYNVTFNKAVDFNEVYSLHADTNPSPIPVGLRRVVT